MVVYATVTNLELTYLYILIITEHNIKKIAWYSYCRLLPLQVLT
jgi:hypothetical protein